MQTKGGGCKRGNLGEAGSGQEVVKMRSFLGCCDASDVVDGELCIKHHEGVRRPCKLSLLGVGVHVDERKGKTRGREKWLELTLYLSAGKRTDCSCGQA